MDDDLWRGADAGRWAHRPVSGISLRAAEAAATEMAAMK